MRFESSVFHRLLKPLDRRVLNRIVGRHDCVGTGSKAWSCQRHLKTMLFAQFAGVDSLRQIEQALGAHPGGLYHLALRVPRRSTLSDAQTCRAAAVFRDVCGRLMGLAQRTMRRQAAQIVELIDATLILLRDPRFGWADDGYRARGLKVHVGFAARADVVEWVEVTSAKTSDIAAARGRPIAPKRAYVFDKGYFDYNRGRQLLDGQALFVSRLKSNTRRRDVIAQPVEGEDSLADNHLKLGHAAPCAARAQ